MFGIGAGIGELGFGGLAMGLRCYASRPNNVRDRGGSCGVCAAVGDVWVRLTGGDREDLVGKIGAFSHESEHDLALMVSDFLENGSGGSGSRYVSSDSDSGNSDLGHLADMIAMHKQPVDQIEIDLLSNVQMLLICIRESDIYCQRDGTCNGSCIRKSLVKLLRASGYDASICISKWQSTNKIPGGDHEYIDVLIDGSERMIIDLDFRSHFEIARAVNSYDALLCSLPVVYVGSWNRLKQLLQIMVEAARFSLQQNSMPLPPWRSIGYLQAKWQSPSERLSMLHELQDHAAQAFCNNQCLEHLGQLKSTLQSEIDNGRLLKPINSHKKWKVAPQRLKGSFFKV